jgi:hypothetical protein
VKSWLKHVQPLLIASAIAVVFGACDEKLESGIACPALCPQQQTALRDTTFFAVDLDTAIAGYPTIGQELRMFVASMGDTLQTRGVVRYDSLPATFRHKNSVTDSAIIAVDTGAYVRLSIVTGDTLAAPTTVEIYDVDLGGPDDSDPTAVTSAFTANRLLGSRTIRGDSLRDSLRVPIDRTKLLAKIQAAPPANRLRIGIKVGSTGTTRLTMLTANGSAGARLVFRPAADTSVTIATVEPRSKTPAEQFIASDLADYLVVAKGPPDAPANVIRVGGLPGRRAYLRFNIPASIIDSANVVRATLLVTQRPSRFSPQPKDTLELQPYALAAASTVPDLSRALLLLTSFCPVSSVRLVPADSGVRSFEISNVVKCWRATKPDQNPRALALVSAKEGELPRQVDFFSLEAPTGVRPRLRVTYVPKIEAGIP